MTNYANMEKIEGIKVNGHRGTWYSIQKTRTVDGHTLFLMEHETYGDEAASVIIDETGTLLLDGVYNGFDDYIEALESKMNKPYNNSLDFVRKVMTD